MNRFLRHAALVCLAVLLPATFLFRASAESLSGAPEVFLDGVDAAIEEITIDNEGGTPDKTTKKLLKALLKARKPLLKNSTSLAKDAKNMAAAMKTLRKVFDPDSDLAFAVDDARSHMEGTLLEGAQTTFDMLQTIEDAALKAKARDMQQVVDDLVFSDDDGSDPYASFKFQSKAAATLEKFRAWLDAQGVRPPDPPVIPFTAKVDGGSFLGEAVTAQYDTTTGRFYLKGLDARTLPFRSLVIEIPTGITGAGSTSLAGGAARYEVGLPVKVSTSNGGTLTIAELDAPGKVVRGTFAFTVSGPAGAATVTEGTFDVRDLVVTGP